MAIRSRPLGRDGSTAPRFWEHRPTLLSNPAAYRTCRLGETDGLQPASFRQPGDFSAGRPVWQDAMPPVAVGIPDNTKCSQRRITGVHLHLHSLIYLPSQISRFVRQRRNRAEQALYGASTTVQANTVPFNDKGDVSGCVQVQRALNLDGDGDLGIGLKVNNDLVQSNRRVWSFPADSVNTALIVAPRNPPPRPPRQNF